MARGPSRHSSRRTARVSRPTGTGQPAGGPASHQVSPFTLDRLPETVRFLTELTRLQRRLRVVAFFRAVQPIAAISFLLAEIAVIVVHLTWAQGALWLVGATALAGACAGVVALIQTRSLRRTASVLDSRFRLEDRGVTALEFAGHSDSVSRLIVTDAGARLAAHASSELSFESPAWLPSTLAGVVGVSVILAIVLNPVPAFRAGLSGQASAGSNTRGARATNQSAPAPAPLPTGRNEREEVTSARSGSSSAEPAANSRQAEASPIVQPHIEGVTGDSRSQEDVGQARASSTVRAPSEGQAESRPGSLGQASGGGQRAGTAQTQGDRGVGPGGGSISERGTGAGGVRGGSLSNARSNPAQRIDNPSRDSPWYRGAWAQAQSPVVQQRVPAARRAYIRDYFLAIRPTGQP